MKTKISFILKLPEYLLLIAVGFYWFSSGLLINPMAIGLVVVLILQIVFKNRFLGLVIPSVLILACVYMMLAVLSEFNEFPSFTAEAKELLFVGLIFFISTLAVSGVMLYKYALDPMPTPQEVSVD